MSPQQRTGLTRRERDLAARAATFEARSFHGVVHGTVPVRSAHGLVDDDGRPVALEAELDLAGLSTGNPRRDKDLRSPRFFDTGSHPVMRFRADDVVPSGEGWQVRGTLSIGAAACPLVMHVARGGEFYDGFTGTVAVTTRELGVRAPRILIRERVTLRISARLLG